MHEQICRELKLESLELARESSIDIENDQSEIIGFLVPVGTWVLDDFQTVESIQHWRQRAMKNYLIQFESNYQRTWDYLQQKAILDDSRILFMIAEIDGNFLGHVGLCNISNDSAELDNLMRGYSGGAIDLMKQAEKALLKWAFLKLQMSWVSLRVLSFNILAIEIHKQLGFDLAEQFPLRMEIKNGDRTLLLCDRDLANLNYSLFVMVLTHAKFSSLE